MSDSRLVFATLRKRLEAQIFRVAPVRCGLREPARALTRLSRARQQRGECQSLQALGNRYALFGFSYIDVFACSDDVRGLVYRVSEIARRPTC